jgi:hypothetical protein
MRYQFYTLVGGHLLPRLTEREPAIWVEPPRMP